METAIPALAPAMRLIEPPLAPRLKITKFVLLSRAAKISGPNSADAYSIPVLQHAHHLWRGELAAADGVRGSGVRPAACETRAATVRTCTEQITPVKRGYAAAES